MLGPFYRPHAPFRKNLNPADFNGEELHISGRIMTEDGKSPISDYLIEILHPFVRVRVSSDFPNLCSDDAV